MKKIVISIILPFFLFSCSKKEASAADRNDLQAQPQVQNKSVENPDYKFIDEVLSRMSQRAQKEIKITDKDSFLKDFKKVLEVEKTFPQDDISLFYLIDKKNNIENDDAVKVLSLYNPESTGHYVPFHLVALKKNSLYQINKNSLSLREDVEKGLQGLAKGALDDGISLTVSSTYRSYEYQDRLFKHWVEVDGLEEAERESARPGTSQHQLGVAIDFGNIDDSFIETKQGKWLYEHAQEYGWSLSFPKEYEDITGYRWECWHYRFIGKEACRFQKKWFNNVQQYMLEFINLWKSL